MIFKRLRQAWRNRGRQIYQYTDGVRWRYADPLVIARKLINHPEFNWETHPALVDSGDDEAIAITAKAVRDAFDLPEYDGSEGLTEVESLALLVDFTQYIELLKKSISPSPISPELTESESSSESTTNAESDCGPMPAESSCDVAAHS